MADHYLEDTETSLARLSAIQRALSESSFPLELAYRDERNPVIAEKKSMEALFSSLEERGVHQPKKLTEFEVYSRLEEYAKRGKHGT